MLNTKQTEISNVMLRDRGAITGNFNNYTEPGIYYYTGSQSVLNNPGDFAGNVEIIVTTAYVIQRISTFDRMCERRLQKQTAVWTNWTSCLVNTNIAMGSKTVTLTAGGAITDSIVFDTPFSKDPVVLVNLTTQTPQRRSIAVVDRSSTGFTVSIYDETEYAGDINYTWVAVNV